MAEQKTYGREMAFTTLVWTMGLSTHFYLNAGEANQLVLIQSLVLPVILGGLGTVGLKTVKHVKGVGGGPVQDVIDGDLG